MLADAADLVVSLANGYIGYVATAQGFVSGV